MRRLWVPLALLLCMTVAGALTPTPTRMAAQSATYMVRTTWYLPTGHPTRSGVYPYVGSAGANWDWLPRGTVIWLNGRYLTIEDTGCIGPFWIDAYAPTWADAAWMQATYGDWGEMTIVAWGQNPPWYRPGTSTAGC